MLDTMITLDELREMMRRPYYYLVDAASFGSDYEGDWREASIARDGVDYQLLFEGDRDPVELKCGDYGRVWSAYRYDGPPRRYFDALLEDDLYYGFAGFRILYEGVSWLAYRISAD